MRTEEILNQFESGDINPMIANFSVLEKEIENEFTMIRITDSVEETTKYFDKLDRIQTALATIAFKHQVNLTSRLRKFVRDFDRLDSDDVVRDLYDKLRFENYTLHDESGDASM